ncbi:unnamed protein product [Effrenium voratum]|uniref:Uncharacterized protein n=1 Tax=Effrenium voratum TaxID=2562239 RepID=A0AA36JRY2_9DINO|nr:unnamed protein product [Effrenium voratum]CAJ1458770.1 unnamed protein product [Effrenium voratum]
MVVLRSRSPVAVAVLCAALFAVQAFVAPRASPSAAHSAAVRSEPAAFRPVQDEGEIGISASALVGLWAAAGLTVAGRTALRAEESPKEEKKPFNVWEPDTYGNISMDDVKKYGAAGTLSYVITELLFWAIAFPTECIVYLNTAGHWPDFSKPEESAAVFGLVFAASNIARLLLPLRFGAALAMAPWVDENIMQRFKEEAKEGA